MRRSHSWRASSAVGRPIPGHSLLSPCPCPCQEHISFLSKLNIYVRDVLACKHAAQICSESVYCPWGQQGDLQYGSSTPDEPLQLWAAHFGHLQPGVSLTLSLQLTSTTYWQSESLLCMKWLACLHAMQMRGRLDDATFPLLAGFLGSGRVSTRPQPGAYLPLSLVQIFQISLQSGYPLCMRPMLETQD